MRKKITRIQRARQKVSRVNALQTAVSYERKMKRRRTASIKASLDALVARHVPPSLWADEVEYSEPWMLPLLTDMYLTIGHEGGVETLNRLLQQKAVGDDIFTRAVLQWAQDHLGERITLMGDTVAKWLREHIAEIYEAHSTDGVEALTQRLYRGTMHQWAEVKDWMCRRIAQTEAMKAMNIAATATADGTGIDYEKTWSIAGINTRETHAAVDGITIPKGELFTVGGFLMNEPMDETYGAPAGEVINCACTLIILPRDNGITEI